MTPPAAPLSKGPHRMAINWFPGHMLTARKDALATMAKTDVVIEVLDARVPFSSCNPSFEALRRLNQRPALKLLNKTDVADEARTKAWLAYYNAQPGTKAYAVSARNPGEISRIPAWCQALAPHRGTKLKPLRLMILGVPNVGKSTLMNALLKRHVAKVGDEPAITKEQKFHQLSATATLVDTPGMLWPEVTQYSAVRLAATHSIGRNAYDDEDVAAQLGTYLLADYAPLVEKRYGVIPAGADGHGLLAAIAKGRGLLLPGGVPDIAKAAGQLLHDFRNGLVGRVSLESVEQVEALPPPPKKKGRGR